MNHLMKFFRKNIVWEGSPGFIVNSVGFEYHERYMEKNPTDHTEEIYGYVPRTIEVPKEHYGKIIKVGDIRTRPNDDFTGILLHYYGDNDDYSLAFFTNGRLLKTDEIVEKVPEDFTGYVSVTGEYGSSYARFKNGKLVS